MTLQRDALPGEAKRPSIRKTDKQFSITKRRKNHESQTFSKTDVQQLPRHQAQGQGYGYLFQISFAQTASGLMTESTPYRGRSERLQA